MPNDTSTPKRHIKHITKHYSPTGSGYFTWCDWFTYDPSKITADRVSSDSCKRCLKAYDKAMRKALGDY